MEWINGSSPQWDWDNPAVLDGRRADNSKPYFSPLEGEWEIDNGSLYSASGGVCSGSDPGNGCSSRSSISASFDMTLPNMAPGPGVPDISVERANTVVKGTYGKKDIANAEDSRISPDAALSVGSGEACIGLGLGKRTYFKDFPADDNIKISPLSSATTSSSNAKRCRVSRKNTQAICCQVEGCDLDLTNAKDYHRKHKICESHSKCPKVIVAGLERRFCQQCSRFHSLAEFDQKKRSCRRRLSDHNARRRKPPPEMISFSAAKMPSSIYDDRHQINFLSNRSPYPFDQTRSFPTTLWDGSSSMYQLAEAKEPSMRWAPVKGVRQPSLPLNEMPAPLFDLHSDNQPHILSSAKGDSAKFLSQGMEASIAASNLDGARDLPRALSLLSNDSWGSSDPGPSSLSQVVQMEHTSIFPEVHLMYSSSDSWPIKVPSENKSKLLISSYNNATQFQQFQLLKPTCERTSLNFSHIFLGDGRKP